MNKIIKNNASFHIVIILALFVLNVSSCKKDETKIAPLQFTDSIKDIEGNVYKTVLIGKQWWMAENLRVTVYNDSTPITKVSVNPGNKHIDTLWSKNTKGAYCTYENKNELNFIRNYGRLYNWYAVNNIKLVPDGWHIPTDDEWKELEQQLGMSAADAENTSWRGSEIGKKMKQFQIDSSGKVWTTDTKLKLYENNESGFSALPGGSCMFDGDWSENGIGLFGFWWTKTEKGNEAWYRHLDYKKTTVFRYYGSKSYGFSVRCVKNL